MFINDINHSNLRYNLEVMQNRAAASAQLQQGVIASTSTAAMHVNPGNLNPLTINEYGTATMRTLFGLVSQALYDVKELKINQNNLQRLRQLYSSSSPLLNREENQKQTRLLSHVIQETFQKLRVRIQMVNESIACFQASPMSQHPVYLNEVNKHRQLLNSSLEELRRMSNTTSVSSTSAPMNPGMTAVYSRQPSQGLPAQRQVGIGGHSTSNTHAIVTSTTRNK